MCCLLLYTYRFTAVQVLSLYWLQNISLKHLLVTMTTNLSLNISISQHIIAAYHFYKATLVRNMSGQKGTPRLPVSATVMSGLIFQRALCLKSLKEV